MVSHVPHNGTAKAAPPFDQLLGPAQLDRQPLDADLRTLLRTRSMRVREHIVRMAARGGCYVGSALSCVDLLVYLYTCFLNFTADHPDAAGRDYLFLSKGHAVPALYGVLAELGLLAPERFGNHLHAGDSIYWHPNATVPGVEFHAGSLGHLLPVAAGVALDCKLRRQDNRVVVVVGDGELNEGTNWEACMVASARRLDNLIVVVDRNGFQANVRTETLVPLEPMALKFQAFGVEAARVEGHDFAALHALFSRLPLAPGAPSAVIADTVRGRGLPSLEARADRWFAAFTPAEAETLLAELHTTHP
ncbi:MAG: thiamine pyrophosphate-dependent enzyme [Burkholderiaceae bacterium]|nr:thiamine pyrophosphate-dependent enzyme [Burkholderiaceae bacterium]